FASKDTAANEAEQRFWEVQRRRQRRWMISASVACFAVILVLTADFIYARANSAPFSSRAVAAAADLIHIPLAEVQDGNLHIFTVKSGTQDFHFIIIKKPQGWGVALDACRICGAEGYRQDGQNVVCRHCASAIYIPTIGEAGGCNPVGLLFRIEGSEIVVNVSSITRAFTEVPK